MEDKSKLSESRPLIDFNSPVPVRAPLIPVPPSNLLCESPPSKTPFDAFEKQTVSPDPFERVLHSAFQKLNDSRKTSLNSSDQSFKSEDGPSEFNHKETSESDGAKKDINLSFDNKSNCSSKHEHSSGVSFSKNEAESEEIGYANNISPNKREVSLNVQKKVQTTEAYVNKNEKHQNSQNETPTKNTSIIKNSSKSDVVIEGDSQSHISGDLSTDEGIKAVIAKRVSKCIQNVLNNSFTVKNKQVNIKFQNRRSLSFVACSPRPSETKCDRLNKSFTNGHLTQNTSSLKNPEVITTDTTLGSSDIRPLSPHSAEVSKTENSLQVPDEKEQVFHEANKLARTFSKIAESFCHDAGSDSEDDLLSCKPRWYQNDSSEDEEEKLLKDPALNIRVSRTQSLHIQQNDQSKIQIDSPALAAFKRKRSSTTLPGDTSLEEYSIKSSFNAVLKQNTPAVPVILTSVPLVQPDENSIKLKKKSAQESKRGPMKAMMPVQNMTKESSKQEGGDTAIKEETSPVRKLNLQQSSIETPNKDISNLGMNPVASSTPNKPEVFKSISQMPQLLKPTIEIPSDKRRSLGSTIESRKSRAPLLDTGAKKRSNSANSNIPARLEAPKPLKSLPQIKSMLKPKSSINLQHSSPRNTKVTQADNVNGGKSTKTGKLPIKSVNNMPLTKIRQSRVKSAVNSISNLVTGKSKKAAVLDKENRAPV